MLFFVLLNVKMPTFVGILTFMGRKKIMLSGVEYEIIIITLGSGKQYQPSEMRSIVHSVRITDIPRIIQTSKMLPEI